MSRRKAKIVEGILIPGRYQDQRKAEKLLAEKRRLERMGVVNKEVKEKRIINKIPFRCDSVIISKEGAVISKKTIIYNIDEHKLLNDEKYKVYIDLIGGLNNMLLYIKWFNTKEKSEEQLTSLNLYDIKNYISNLNKTK
jgi:hypothetical protein